MTFKDVIFEVAGALGWVIIALTALALIFVVIGYARTANEIRRQQGWSGLWQHIRKHVLTRPPRQRH